MQSEPPEGFPTAEDEAFHLAFIAKEQPEAWRVPVAYRVPCNGCGQYLTRKRENWTFEGDHAVTRLWLECQHGCMVSASLEYREFSPKPS